MVETDGCETLFSYNEEIPPCIIEGERKEYQDEMRRRRFARKTKKPLENPHRRQMLIFKVFHLFYEAYSLINWNITTEPRLVNMKLPYILSLKSEIYSICYDVIKVLQQTKEISQEKWLELPSTTKFRIFSYEPIFVEMKNTVLMYDSMDPRDVIEYHIEFVKILKEQVQLEIENYQLVLMDIIPKSRKTDCFRKLIKENSEIRKTGDLSKLKTELPIPESQVGPYFANLNKSTIFRGSNSYKK